MLKRNPIDTYCDKKIPTLQKAYDGLIDYIDISSVDNTEKKIVSFQTLAAKDAPSRAKQLLKKGDILVSTVRPNLNAVAIVEEETENLMVGSTGYCVLRCNGTMDNRYLFNFCQSQYFIDDMTSQATGASYPAVSNGIVRNSLIPVYPIEQQREIADRLDTVSNLIALRKQQLSELDNLVKSRFIELFGNGNYPRTDLINLIVEGAGLSYGIVQPGDDGTGDMGVLRPVDLVDGKISTTAIKYIDRSIGDSFKKTELTGNELLITVRGTTGITALTDSRFVGMNVTRGIAVVRYDRSKINPIYLQAYLNTDESQQYIQEHTRGATLQQINLSDLRNQQILVPPMAVQEQMAAFVEHTDKLKFTVRNTITIYTALILYFANFHWERRASVSNKGVKP